MTPIEIRSAIIRSVKEDEFDVVRATLQSFGSKKEYVATVAIRWAALYGRLDVVKFLLEEGEDVHALRRSALFWAAEHDHHEIVQLLLQAIQAINEGDGYYYDLVDHAITNKGFNTLAVMLIFEVVRAPVWEWAITLAVLSHFDRSNTNRNPDDAWAGNFPLVTDLLVRTVNLATGQVFQSYCVGRCLDGTNENCLLQELLLPMLVFDAAPPRIEEIPNPGPQYSSLGELYVSNHQTDCPICTFPLAASQFLLVQRLRQYHDHRFLLSLEGVIPGNSDSIETIRNAVATGENSSMPVRLFTCTHKFHLGCIGQLYCRTVRTRGGPNCPICRAPMLRNLTEERRVPTTTVYYPVSI